MEKSHSILNILDKIGLQVPSRGVSLLNQLVGRQVQTIRLGPLRPYNSKQQKSPLDDASQNPLTFAFWYGTQKLWSQQLAKLASRLPAILENFDISFCEDRIGEAGQDVDVPVYRASSWERVSE
jgi:hypothetical protein